MTFDANVAGRLRLERDRLELSQAAMAEAVGVRREMWARYEAGTEPGAGVLIKAIQAGVDVLFVLTGRHAEKAQAVGSPPPVRPDTAHPGTPAVGGAINGLSSALLAPQDAAASALGWVWQQGEERREYRVIPKITEHVCAGLPPAEGDAGQAGAQHAKAGVLAFEARYMRAVLGSDEDRFMTLQVEGDSMVPTLLDGDLVAIDVTATRINVSGIYVLRFAGQLTIKRVMRMSDGAVIVSSDNRAYAAADERFTAAAASTLAVVGRMVWPRVR